jgi:membrane protein
MTTGTEEPEAATVGDRWRSRLRSGLRVFFRLERRFKGHGRRLERRVDRIVIAGVLVASVRRFTKIDGRSRVAAIALDVFVALVPLTILMTAFLHEGGGHTYGSLLVKAFTLQGRTATVVNHAFGLDADSRRAASAVAIGSFVVAGFDLTNALQVTYDRAWQVASRTGIGSGLRGLLWLALAAGYQLVLTIVGAIAGDSPWSEALAVVLALFPIGVLFWLLTPALLLNRKLGWRDLLPGAVVCTIGQIGLQETASLFVPSTISQYYNLFGQFGVAIALLFWVWLSALLWVSAAVVNAVMWERRSGVSAAEEPQASLLHALVVPVTPRPSRPDR